MDSRTVASHLVMSNYSVEQSEFIPSEVQVAVLLAMSPCCVVLLLL